jgi:pimeloyl-ACP methyl ester carboxylesterase
MRGVQISYLIDYPEYIPQLAQWLFEQWGSILGAQERLAKLVPNGKHITKTNSGHEIHKEQPQIVIDAIREVVEAVRSGRRQLTR